MRIYKKIKSLGVGYSFFIPKSKNLVTYELFRIIISFLVCLGSSSLSNYLYFQYNPLLGVSFVGEVVVGSLFFALIYFTIPYLSNALVEDIKKIIQGIVEDILQLDRRKTNSKVKLPKILESKIKPLILDTSVIIDGRFMSLIELGFMQRQVIVPQFVINELHMLSDSKSKLKRDKGRRGLQILENLKIKAPEYFRIYPTTNGGDVDSRLVSLAKKIKAGIATVDYNLAKVAEIKGIKTLNINKLALSLKTVLIPGEVTTIQITSKGSEENQGVGYLEDGTMVVVKGAGAFINKFINIKVSKVIQKETGKIIFADITTSK